MVFSPLRAWYSAGATCCYGRIGRGAVLCYFSHNRQKNNQLREEIAQRKQAVEIVRKSEQRFRSVFDQQFQLMAILAPDGRVLEVNELALRMQNYARGLYRKLFWDSPAWQDRLSGWRSWRQRLQQAARRISDSDGGYL